MRVTLKRNRVADFRSLRLSGIWNHKPKRPAYVEIELPITKDESTWLRYTVPVTTGKFFSNAVRFGEGTIELNTAFVPSAGQTKVIGKFNVRPVAPKPMVDRNLRC